MLKVKIELDHPNAKMPIKGSLKAACWDVFAASINMLDTNTYEVSLGFKLEPPEGYKVVLVPRSSITKTEVIQQNSPGQGDCVPAGTLIATPAGEIPIEDIYKLNSPVEILCYDEQNGKLTESFITDKWIETDLELIEIETIEGDVVVIPNTKQVLTDSGWKIASYLSIKDSILKI